MHLLKPLIFALCVGVATLTQAGTTEARGGRGGKPFTLACPDGQKIGGFQVRAGRVIDGLGIACVPINAPINGNPVIDGFTGQQGGEDYRYNVQPPQYVRSVTATACKYKDRTVIRSIRIQYSVPGQNSSAWGISEMYGEPCDSTHPPVNHIAPPGQHIYGIYGKAGSAIDSLGVLFRPLPVLGRQQRIPIDGLLTSLNRLMFKDSSIKFDNLGSYGKDGGFLKDASRLDIGGLVKVFSIEPFSYRRNKGIYRVEYYVDDLRSSDMFLSHRSAHAPYVELNVEFETSGRELKGFCRKKLGKKYFLCLDDGDILPDAEIVSPRARFQMVPEVFNGTCGNRRINGITFVPTASEFEGDLKIAGNARRIPDEVEDAIKRAIEDRALNKMLNNMVRDAQLQLTHRMRTNQVQCQIASLVRDEILDPLGVTVRSVGVDGSDLVVGY